MSRNALIILAMVPLAASAQRPIVLVDPTADLRASVARLPALRAAGMDVSVIAAPGTFVGTLRSDSPRTRETLGRLGKIFSGAVDEQALAQLPEHQRIGPAYLNALLQGRFDSPAVRAPMDWSGHPEGDHDDVVDRSGDGGGGGGHGGPPCTKDWTCTQSYNSERLLGTVVASTFFVESNGAVDANFYTWTPSAISSTKLQVIDAWSIWSNTASFNGRTVTAVMDWYEPSGGIPVQGYEPVKHPSTQDQLWIGAIMQNAGRTEATTMLQLDGFNHDRRVQVGADNSFCAFIAYNPTNQGAPNQFSDGKVGYALLGGPYVQILYKANGWTTEQINRVYGHELAHVFHAFDEYTASGVANCSRTFNGRQNLNFQGPPCSGSGNCVMVDNSFNGMGTSRRWNLCPHTPYHLGWMGGLATPVCLSPINDVTFPSGSIKLKWDRSGAAGFVVGHVKVMDRTSGALVLCENAGTVDSLMVSLTNGQYSWTVSTGATNDANGYAGTFSQPALFTVAAPLAPAFSVQPGGICAGGSVQVTDATSGAPIAWLWEFPGGDPAVFNGQHPPSITYNSAGSRSITLTVSDGPDTVSTTLANAVDVLGGAALPYAEHFEGGFFPPADWEAPPAQGSPLQWTADATPGCSLQTSAFVNAHDGPGMQASVALITPRLDLTTAAVPYLRFKYAYAQRKPTNTETLVISGHDCLFTVSADLFEQGGAELATNGGIYVDPSWAPTSCGDWREVLIPLGPLAGKVAQLSFELITTGGQNLFLDDIEVFDGLRVPLRALLQGPFIEATGLMRDDLRVQGIIPKDEPYTGSGVVFKGGGGERLAMGATSATGANAVVDWVVVEVRDAASPTIVRASRAALIQADGDIVDVDGIRPVGLPVLTGPYHIAIQHRNHLGMMTATPVNLSGSMSLLDLGSPATPTWGTDGRKLLAGKALLWSGDVFHNNQLKYNGAQNDRDPILGAVGGSVPTNIVAGYLVADVNMDGLVRYIGTANDRDPILGNLNAQVTGVRSAQLP